MRRREFLKAAGTLGVTAALPLPVRGQGAADFPNKPITLIMPWPAGSGIDLWHRVMADAAGKILGQPVVVDNRTGASGTAGPAAMAMTARPDGYTVSHIPITVFRFPFMQKTPYDPLRDFTYIIHLSGFMFGVCVRADSPFKTFNDMIEWARANPGKLTYGTPGAGTSLHIGMEQIALKAGVTWTMVPFKGGPETTAALKGGHIMADAGGVASWWPNVDAGRMRVLVLWTEERHLRLPATPTLKELGYPFVFDSPFGIAGPKGMDPAIVKKLHDAFKAAMNDPKAVDIQTKTDYATRYMDSEDYSRFVRQQVDEQKAVIERLGLARKS